MKMLAVTFTGKNDRGVPAEWPLSPQEFDDDTEKPPECDVVMTSQEYSEHKAKYADAYAAWKMKAHGVDDLKQRIKAEVSAYILAHYSVAQQVTLARRGQQKVFDWIDSVVTYYHKVSETLHDLSGDEMLSYAIDFSEFDKSDPKLDLRDILK